jgi:hypothetical protein
LNKHLKRFRRKVAAKGYQYQSLDDAWLLWLMEDCNESFSSSKTHKKSSSPNLPSMMENVLNKKIRSQNIREY